MFIYPGRSITYDASGLVNPCYDVSVNPTISVYAPDEVTWNAYDLGYTANGDNDVGSPHPRGTYISENNIAYIWVETDNNVYGTRVSGTTELISPVNIYDASSEYWSYGGAKTASCYMPTADSIVFINYGFYFPGFFENPYQFIIVNADTLALQYGPITLSETSVYQDDAVAFGYTNSFIVFWTDTSTDKSHYRMFDNEGTALTSTATWKDTGTRALGLQAAQITADNSNLIGLFYHDLADRIKGTIVSSTGGISVAEFNIGNTGQPTTEMFATCQYMYDAEGTQYGWLVLYREDTNLYAVSVSKTGTVGTPVVLSTGVISDYWRCMAVTETYDYNYLILFYNQLQDKSYYLEIDRDFSILIPITQCAAHITMSSLQHMQLIRNEDCYSYAGFYFEDTSDEKNHLSFLYHGEVPPALVACANFWNADELGYTADGDNEVGTNTGVIIQKSANDNVFLWGEDSAGAMYGVRMNACSQITDPAIKVVDDAETWHQCNDADGGYSTNNGVMIYVSDASYDEVRIFSIADDDLTIEKGPKTVDSSTSVRDANIVVYLNFATVFWTNTSAEKMYRVVYNYNLDVVGGKAEVVGSGNPSGVKKAFLEEDDSKFIGLFYTHNAAADDDDIVRATITSDIGTVIVPSVDISRDRGTIGAYPAPLAVCPYKYDDGGSQMGFLLVYEEGDSHRVKYMTRYASGQSSAVEFLNTSTVYNSWTCCEDYDHNYLIIGYNYATRDFRLWKLDRDLNILIDNIVLYETSLSYAPKMQIIQNGDDATYSLMSTMYRLDSGKDQVGVITVSHDARELEY